MRNKLLLAAFLATPAFAWAQTGSGGGTLTARAHYAAFYQGRPPGATIRLLLVLRGQPGWDSAPSSSSGMASASASAGPGVVRYSFSIGSVEFECVYDPERHSLRYRGRDYQLADTNVVFIDRIDGVGGPPEIAQQWKLQLPAYDGRNMPALVRAIPELQGFLR